MKIINFIKKHKWLIAIIGLAFILRFAYLILLDPPLSWQDAGIYDGTAWNFVRGYGYSLPEGIPFSGREPGYALFFLAPIYFIFGHSILAVQIFQIILSAFIILFTYLIARKILSKKMSLLPAFLMAVWPPMVGYPEEILTEIAFTFLLLFFIYLLIKAIETRSSKIALFAGIILGITTLTRFIMFIFPIFLLPIFYFIFKDKRQAFKYFLLISIGLLILVSPWMIRNYTVFDSFVLGRTGGGDIYWMGSYIPWDGEWYGYIYPFTDLCPNLNSPILKDNCLIKLTIENIKENPLKIGLIWLKKPLKTFLVPDGYSAIYKLVSLFNWKLASTQGLYAMIHLGGIILAVLGLKDLFYKKRNIALIFGVLLLYYSLLLLPMNPVARYQVPLLPILAILASFGLNNFYKLCIKLRYG